jgi:hypothetical protein
MVGWSGHQAGKKKTDLRKYRSKCGSPVDFLRNFGNEVDGVCQIDSIVVVWYAFVGLQQVSNEVKNSIAHKIQVQILMTSQV